MLAARVFASFGQPALVTRETDVADVVWSTANDATARSASRLAQTRWRWPAGA